MFNMGPRHASVNMLNMYVLETCFRENSPGSYNILVIASKVVLAIADGICWQEGVWLAGVSEGAVVIIEEHVEG